MAKIDVNFSNVEERVFVTIPTGIYDAKVKEANVKASKAGNPMVEWIFTVEDDITFEYEDPETGDIKEASTKGSWQRTYTVLNDNPFALKAIMKALGHTDEELAANFSFNPDKYVGKMVRLSVGQKLHEGKTLNNVDKVMAYKNDGGTAGKIK